MDSSTTAPNDTKIITGTDADLIRVADELRRSVFVEEQGVPEDEVFDGLNPQAVHIVAFVGETPAATARLISNAEGWRIGLVATVKTYRARRLGKKVMLSAINYILSQGGREIRLTAQEQACGFYEKLGFRRCGEAEPLDSGFVLVPMRLSL